MGHKYDYPINVNDDSAPAKVIRMVGEGKRVLEIGAGPGSMTRILRDRYNCRITAIEVDDESIPILEPYCERVYRLDLNDPLWPRSLASQNGFDVVIAADVLEHLYDPWSTLQQMKTFLNPNGCVIASVPHAGHNTIIASLIDANLEYRQVGLLDRTHIRFFGIRNIQSMFENAGLSIIEAQLVIRHPDDTELRDSWNRIPASMRVALSKNKFGLVYQAVIKAKLSGDGVPGLLLSATDVPKAVQLRTGLLARLEEVRQEVSAERTRIAVLQQELAAERERVSGVSVELWKKGDAMAAIEQQVSVARQEISQLKQDLARQQQELAAANNELLKQRTSSSSFTSRFMKRIWKDS